MSENEPALHGLVAQAERVGVIGSPSSTTEIALDILGSASARKLVGELALFEFLQDGDAHYALGQIVEIQLRNIWHEDPTMRSLIRQRGKVDAVSERQDTHLGKMTISAVFRASAGALRYQPSILGTVPSTGTSTHIVADALLDELLGPYRNQLFYLGTVYGSTPRLPLWFKHFGSGEGGAGEAYHLGIFGKTGSGKSVLAKMILLAYARHKSMALLVIDPQGEFARDIRDDGAHGGFELPLGGIARNMGRRCEVLTVRNLILDHWTLFEQILRESPFFDRLTVRAQNLGTACEILTEKLRKNKKVNLEDLHQRDSFDKAWELLQEQSVQQNIYVSPQPRERFSNALSNADPDQFYNDYWRPATRLFDKTRPGARGVDDAIKSLLSTGDRPILVVDLSADTVGDLSAGPELLWNNEIQSIVIRRLLRAITQQAENAYSEGQSLNALVLIDEAHRLAPRYMPEEEDTARDVRRILIDAVRTTRKYGLGWLFISQTLSSVHRQLLDQIRIFFFGFGLGLGQEFQSLRDLVGSSSPALELYRLFQDPHSAFDPSNRQYSFMTHGPVSPLSFSGSPLFLNVFNRVHTFMETNNLSASENGAANRDPLDHQMPDSPKKPVTSGAESSGHSRTPLPPPNDTGYCIRCRNSLRRNKRKPYCIDCYKSWAKDKQPDQAERYCHFCGSEHPAQLNQPACPQCA